MALKLYPVFFEKNFEIDGSDSTGKVQKIGCRIVGKKMVWAENAEMAEKIADCIARHDKDQWGVYMDYDMVSVCEPVG